MHLLGEHSRAGYRDLLGTLYLGLVIAGTAGIWPIVVHVGSSLMGRSRRVIGPLMDLRDRFRPDQGFPAANLPRASPMNRYRPKNSRSPWSYGTVSLGVDGPLDVLRVLRELLQLCKQRLSYDKWETKRN